MKMVFVILVIVGWFLVGGVVNYLFYGNKDEQYRIKEKSSGAKTTHLILNIATVSIILVILFGN